MLHAPFDPVTLAIPFFVLAVILGILAFVASSPFVLLEVALLCLGVGVLMAGSFQGLSRI